jgi:hypothetical protein
MKESNMSENNAMGKDDQENKPVEKTWWLDSSENVTKLYRTVWAVGLALIGIDLVVHRHAETAFDGWFGFFGVYGFVACVSLVIAAKGLRRIVMRPEDYYER